MGYSLIFSFFCLIFYGLNQKDVAVNQGIIDVVRKSGGGYRVMLLVNWLIILNSVILCLFFTYFLYNPGNAFLFSQVGIITIINLLFLYFIRREVC